MRVFKIVVVAFMLLFMGTVTAQAQEDGAQVSVAALDGKGQVLINPYYNINIATAMNYFRIVNTSDDQGVGVKVRLNRATDSEEVFDFYVCLSAKDEFSGWILPIVEGGVIVGGEIVSADSPNAPETPTYPPIPPATTDCGTCGVIPIGSRREGASIWKATWRSSASWRGPRRPASGRWEIPSSAGWSWRKGAPTFPIRATC